VTLGIVYCLGIVISFVALGVVFTLVLGAGGASAFAQSPITLAAIGILFVVFALSLFGMFDLQLPASVMNLVGSAQGKGGTLGVWLLGLLFAVTTFTCTAPFVGSILASAAASGQWTRPVLGMVAFSGVLAVPFFFLSVFPARLKSLPRAGSWLNEVKVVMGFVELAAAFKFFGDMDGTVVFTRPMILCAWAAFSLACGLYLLGVFRLPHDSPKERVGVLGMLVALLCLGFAFYLTRGFSGDPLHAQIDVYLPRESADRTPVGRRLALIKEMRANLGGVGGAGSHQEPMGRVGYDAHYRNAYEDARAEAKRLSMPLFVDFTGFA
jgi:thiol:disulfide interchange protein DsbD